MAEKWSTYNLYPQGENVQNTYGQLNAARMQLEEKLKKMMTKYNWFTLLYSPDRIKFGLKLKDKEDLQLIKDFLKNKYPELIIKDGDEKADVCELASIATQCRLVLENQMLLSKCMLGRIPHILHFMLNPLGYDFEGITYLQVLLEIGKGIGDKDLKEALSAIPHSLKEKIRRKMWRGGLNV